jgi:hypothetical protein
VIKLASSSKQSGISTAEPKYEFLKFIGIIYKSSVRTSQETLGLNNKNQPVNSVQGKTLVIVGTI